MLHSRTKHIEIHHHSYVTMLKKVMSSLNMLIAKINLPTFSKNLLRLSRFLIFYGNWAFSISQILPKIFCCTHSLHLFQLSFESSISCVCTPCLSSYEVISFTYLFVHKFLYIMLLIYVSCILLHVYVPKMCDIFDVWYISYLFTFKNFIVEPCVFQSICL